MPHVQYLAHQGASTHLWHRWGVLAIVAAWWLGFSLLLVLALKYISFASFVEPTGREDVSNALARVKRRAESVSDVRRDGASVSIMI